MTHLKILLCTIILSLFGCASDEFGTPLKQPDEVKTENSIKIKDVLNHHNTGDGGYWDFRVITVQIDGSDYIIVNGIKKITIIPVSPKINSK